MRRMSALTLLLFIGPAFGQSLTPFERGTQSFRAVLNRCGLKPVESITDALIDPSHTLIVMFGDLNVHDNEFANGGMRKFIRRGGAMFMASDRNSFGEMWVQLEIAVNGIKITGPDDDPDVIYRGELRDCPMLQHPVRENVRSSLD